MRKFIVGLVVGAIAVFGATSVSAHHGPMHRGVYRKVNVDQPAFFPWRVVIRCPGAAEDTWGRLFLIDVRGQGEPGAGDDVYVYRCDLSV